MATLNNNQVASVLNAALGMSVGEDVIDTLDLQGIIDTGNLTDVIGSKEQFTKALINVLIKNWFTDESYRNSLDDPYYIDSEAFGALTQVIDVEVPEVQNSHAWTEYTSGTTTVGTYTVYLPVVSSQIYGLSLSFELPITITDNQWNTAFHSAAERSTFVNYIWLCIDNALAVHMEDVSAMNRNNFIAQKIAYQNGSNPVGSHAINLVKEYCDKYNVDGMTVNEFRTSPKALLFATQQIELYRNYMKKMSTRFNTAGKKKFVSDDRMVVEVLADFEADIATVALSNTYHDTIVSLKGHRTIPAWQGLVDDAQDNTIDFDAVSTIDVEVASDGTKVTQSGIVAFLCDRLAVGYTLVDKYLAHQRFDINRIDMYAYQFTERRMNNLQLPALVFYLEDVEAQTV